jgi:hypothetical protein
MILTQTDSKGNVITAVNDGITAIISLTLHGDNRKRNIGTIILSERIIEMKRIKAKHLFRKFDAYGFNYKILKETKLFDTIRLTDDNTTWVIPVSQILEKGKILNFDSAGFELQIFMPLEEMNGYQAVPMY